jgi:tetratricopeptide (TPR) repeat protein
VDLAFLEGVLRALAETREAEIDSGRWQKEVETFDRCIVYKLAMPDLLNPPTHQEWLRRGYEPDRRIMERGFADMNRYFKKHPASTIDEMNKTAARFFQGRSIDDLVTQPETPAEKAQDLCYQAFATHGRRRVQLARKALETDPNCADAHVILAEQAGTLEAELDHYTQAMAAAEQALGPEIFQEGAGHFWGVTETRPYMRARFGVAQALEEAGRIEEAIGHYQGLLRLNPNDNQGARYLLMPRLLQTGRDAEAARLLKQYDEQSANWVYARALLAFRLSGSSQAARRELREAFRINSHVPEILLEDEPLSVPPYYSPGSPEEALVCVHEIRPAFQQTDGAIEWLAAEYQRWDREREARRKERIRKQKKRKGR